MTKHAVVIGIDRYRDAPLHGCVADASDVGACLALEGFDFDVNLLLDQDATRTNILRAIGEISFDRPQPGDTLLIYFAGHGLVRADSGYLVTADAQPYDPGISLADLSQLIESASTNFASVICILDCCHAGAAQTWFNSRPLSASNVEREVSVVNESRSILAACAPEQEAIELSTRDPHGVFTEALLDGLLGAAVDFHGNVSLMSLYDYATSAIPSEIQNPVFKGDITGTVLIGSGFEPRVGAPIDSRIENLLLSKAKAFVDQQEQLHFRELRDRVYRSADGGRKCARQLESVLRWFDERERDSSDIQRRPEWRAFKSELRNFQSELADIRVGENLTFGQVTAHIGAGGFGQVWKVETADDRTMAFKVFHGSELADEVKVARFRNGFHNMRKLDHPRIVQVSDLSTAPFGFIMQYINGPDLRQAHLDRSDAGAIITLLSEVAETVAYAHAGQVRHRDIKPENIVLEYSDADTYTPYLTDFDLAYHETNRTITNVLGVGGVINYAAPEQLYEPNAQDARLPTVDIFGFAQLAFFVLTGRDPSPEMRDENVDTLRSLLQGWVDDRAASALLELYSNSTRRDPAERPQTMTQVHEWLQLANAAIQRSEAEGGAVRIEDFARRVAVLYAGLGRFEDSAFAAHFSSLSDALRLSVEVREARDAQTCCVTIGAVLGPRLLISGVKNSEQARISVDGRLDRALARFNAQRHRGKHTGGYSVSVDAPDTPLTADGIETVAMLLRAVISSIENW